MTRECIRKCSVNSASSRDRFWAPHSGSSFQMRWDGGGWDATELLFALLVLPLTFQ